MSTSARAAFFATCFAFAVLPFHASSQTFPSKPMRIVVPYAAGGAGDTLTRPVAQSLSALVSQPVVVENRSGANGAVGADVVAKSPPDGYTLTITTSAHYALPFVMKSLPYDTQKDFTPVILLAYVPLVLAVHPSLPVNSLPELIDYAKMNPGKVYYGSTGNGSHPHLAGVLLAQAAGIQIEHVAYKGGAPALQDLLGGQIKMGILTATTIMPRVPTGTLRALALMEGKRAPRIAPGVPTVGETVPGYAMPPAWFGVLGPGGMPHGLVARLNAGFRQALLMPDVRARVEGLGFEVTPSTPEEFVETVNADTEMFRKVVGLAGLKPE
jgi:tripartite-type tricarboxylate transporter receptor subunit TctC